MIVHEGVHVAHILAGVFRYVTPAEIYDEEYHAERIKRDVSREWVHSAAVTPVSRLTNPKEYFHYYNRSDRFISWWLIYDSLIKENMSSLRGSARDLSKGVEPPIE